MAEIKREEFQPRKKSFLKEPGSSEMETWRRLNISHHPLHSKSQWLSESNCLPGSSSSISLSAGKTHITHWITYNSNHLKTIMLGLAFSNQLPKCKSDTQPGRSCHIRMWCEQSTFWVFLSFSQHPAPSSCPWRICHGAGSPSLEMCLLISWFCLPSSLGPQNPKPMMS